MTSCENATMVLEDPPGGGVAVEHDGPVTVVTIDRPDRRNAVDSVAADLLREAFLAFDYDVDRSVAVLTARSAASVRSTRASGIRKETSTRELVATTSRMTRSLIRAR